MLERGLNKIFVLCCDAELLVEKVPFSLSRQGGSCMDLQSMWCIPLKYRLDKSMTAGRSLIGTKGSVSDR